MDPQRKLRDPKTIGQWKVGRVIGQGSSGRVRIARHNKTNQLAAIKIISKSSLATSQVTFSGLADQVEREMLAIEREIVIMKLLNHPNILHLYDVWETSSHVYLVLEYTQGGELLDYLCKHGPLSKREVLKAFRQILEAVDYLHRFNIAHRDLKLENILLDKNRNIRIADFGTAAWQTDFSGALDLMTTSCGNPHFTAPEVIKGEPYVGSAADIWSCGVILYAMLTARLPFDFPEVLDKVVAGKFTIPSFVDPFAQNLIKRMLTVDVVKRITMPEIFSHPFIKLHPAKSVVRTLPALDQTARSLKSKSCIDPDIFANLRALWRDTSDEDLLRSLLNDDKNWQKGIYQLLVNYRAKRNAGDGAFLGEIAKQPVRNGNGVSELQTKTTTLAISGQRGSRQFLTPTCSDEHLPLGAELPTPRKAQARPRCPTSTHAAHSDDMSLVSKEVVRMVPNPRVPQQAPGETMSDIVKWNRDRALPPVPTSTVDANSTMASSRVESEPLVFSLGHNSPGVNHSAAVPRGVFHPQIANFGPGKIRGYHAIDNAQGENEASNDDSGFVYIPISSSLKKIATNGQHSVEQKNAKFDFTHKQHAVRRLLDKRSQSLQAQSQSDLHLPSDDGEASRHAWFNKFLRVKSSYLTKHTFYSVWDIITTRNECRRLLMNMDIHVQVFYQEQESCPQYGEDPSVIVMKCEMDKMEDTTGILGIMKPTKFRAELTGVGERAPRVRPTESGERAQDMDERVERVAVTLIHEKGSGESFREVVRRLKGEWTLEDGGTVEVL